MATAVLTALDWPSTFALPSDILIDNIIMFTYYNVSISPHEFIIPNYLQIKICYMSINNFAVY